VNNLQVTDLKIETLTGTPLVQGISLTVQSGARIGLLGESGSGKSLTALAITRLLPRNLLVEGSIKYGELELLHANESQLGKIRGSQIAIVFQDPLTSLDPVMKIGKQLGKPIARYQGLRGEELVAAIESALAEVKISSPYRVAHSYPHEISGGERQRVAIALALACKPKLLIADEITTSLDVSVQAEILLLLDKIIESRGMGLIFITHDLAVAAQVVNEVVILQSGRVIESGDLQQIIRAPQSDYAKSLIKSARALDDLLENLSAGENL
jgi:peptide/nickel transport system ATP-binding protein